MKKILGMLAATCLFNATAFGVCPLCAVAVGAGVGVSRWLAVDDLISGLWIGGLLMALSLMLVMGLRTSRLNFRGAGIAIIMVFYGMALAPLYWANMFGIPGNTLWGVDRLLAGILVGSVIFIASYGLHVVLKTIHGGTSYVPFQKVIIPITALIVTTALIAWFV